MDAVKLLGALLGNNATGGNLLGSILGGGGRQAAPQQQQSAGAAELLKGILGAAGGAQRSGGGGGLGGLGGLLGGVLGGGGAPSGGGGASSNILGGLLKGAIAKQMGGGGGGASPMDLLGGLLGGGGGQPEPEPQVSQPQRQAANDQATILIRAMCNAAKSDGSVDQAEQQAIIGRLGELDQQEVAFLQQELSSPLDADGFARSVPRELAPQVYALSVMTVKVDTRAEVQYLTQLAQGLGLDQQTLDAIHQQAGLN